MIIGTVQLAMEERRGKLIQWLISRLQRQGKKKKTQGVSLRFEGA